LLLLLILLVLLLVLLEGSSVNMPDYAYR
jgi:hypothetical protein